MSYSVYVLHRETQARYEANPSPAFFEGGETFVAFDTNQLQSLAEALELRGFAETKATQRGRKWVHEEWGAEALLKEDALYLTATGDGIFEILMLGSELANETLARFDPQDGTWQ